jgi:hypothetical protein
LGGGQARACHKHDPLGTAARGGTTRANTARHAVGPGQHGTARWTSIIQSDGRVI